MIVYAKKVIYETNSLFFHMINWVKNMKLLKELYEDAKNIQEKDPAAKHILYVILLYQGFHVLLFYRLGHFFYRT